MKEMRRKDRQLSEQETKLILQKNNHGILSTVCADGYPYGLPISYAYEDGKLFFHCSSDCGMMKENILGEVKACFIVVGATELLPANFATKYESVVAFGRVRESVDKMNILMHLVRKFSPTYEEEGRKYAEIAADRVSVYEFEIEHMTGKARKEG